MAHTSLIAQPSVLLPESVERLKVVTKSHGVASTGFSFDDDTASTIAPSARRDSIVTISSALSSWSPKLIGTSSWTGHSTFEEDSDDVECDDDESSMGRSVALKAIASPALTQQMLEEHELLNSGLTEKEFILLSDVLFAVLPDSEADNLMARQNALTSTALQSLCPDDAHDTEEEENLMQRQVALTSAETSVLNAFHEEECEMTPQSALTSSEIAVLSALEPETEIPMVRQDAMTLLQLCSLDASAIYDLEPEDDMKRQNALTRSEVHIIMALRSEAEDECAMEAKLALTSSEMSVLSALEPEMEIAMVRQDAMTLAELCRFDESALLEVEEEESEMQRQFALTSGEIQVLKTLCDEEDSMTAQNALTTSEIVVLSAMEPESENFMLRQNALTSASLCRLGAMDCLEDDVEEDVMGKQLGLTSSELSVLDALCEAEELLMTPKLALTKFELTVLAAMEPTIENLMTRQNAMTAASLQTLTGEVQADDEDEGEMVPQLALTSSELSVLASLLEEEMTMVRAPAVTAVELEVLDALQDGAMTRQNALTMRALHDLGLHAIAEDEEDLVMCKQFALTNDELSIISALRDEDELMVRKSAVTDIELTVLAAFAAHEDEAMMVAQKALTTSALLQMGCYDVEESAKMTRQSALTSAEVQVLPALMAVDEEEMGRSFALSSSELMVLSGMSSSSSSHRSPAVETATPASTANTGLRAQVMAQCITTLKLAGLSARLSQRKLLKALDAAGFEELYDLCYMPASFSNGRALGYAYVNFKSCEAAALFAEELEAFVPFLMQPVSWNKVVRLSIAATQGLSALLTSEAWLRKAERVRNPRFRPFIAA